VASCEATEPRAPLGAAADEWRPADMRTTRPGGLRRGDPEGSASEAGRRRFRPWGRRNALRVAAGRPGRRERDAAAGARPLHDARLGISHEMSRPGCLCCCCLSRLLSIQGLEKGGVTGPGKTSRQSAPAPVPTTPYTHSMQCHSYPRLRRHLV